MDKVKAGIGPRRLCTCRLQGPSTNGKTRFYFVYGLSSLLNVQNKELVFYTKEKKKKHRRAGWIIRSLCVHM